MRLHHLTVTAFGPFAATTHVDFDELNDAGLFLLTGPTGAGKSSLLDAVCFALYGAVPGARGVKTLKSQHAAADVAPEVVLDVTVQGRRFVVRRTPEWTRAKKRGEGVVTQKASASLTETTGGTEHFLSSRVAEVGHLVSSLMGMSAAQFQQVALLPQGEFQTFLRASSQERHAVLQHLFRTDRFARIEDWVHDHSRRLRDRAGEGEATVRRLVDAVSERAGVETPEELTGDALARATAEDRVLPWVAGLVAEGRAAVAVATAERDRVTGAVDDARAAHDDGVRRLSTARRRDAALQTLASLAQGQPAADAAATTLDAHERAARCAPVLALLREAQHARDAAGDRVRAEGEADLSAEALGELLEQHRHRRSRLEALRPREAELATARSEQRRDEQRLAAAERDEQDAADRARQLPAEVEAAAAELATVATLAAREEAATLAHAAADERHAAAVELTRTTKRLVAAEDRRRDARDRRQDARDRVQQLAARRLAGMAAELAGALREGAPCQVCGSVAHPVPAALGPDPVTPEDQARAEAELASCTATLESVEAECHVLAARRDALVDASGGTDATVLAGEVRACADAVRDAQEAAQTLPALERDLQTLREEQQAVSRRQTEAAATAATLREAVAGREQLLARIEAELDAALGTAAGSAGPQEKRATSVAAAAAEATATVDRLEAAHAAALAHEEAGRRVDELSRTASRAVQEHGFAGADDATAALLDPAEATRLAAALRERSEAVIGAEAVLAEAAPEVETVEELVAQVAACADALAGAEAEAADASRRLVLHEDRLAALTTHHDRLEVTIEQWAPQRDDALRADSISRLVRGMGHDNQLQMRLSAYVLATRLDQVVAAANERLGHMRDQRYLLQRTGRAERRTAQAGLGLEVVDQWTGDVRAPTTLSGGETFVVSLALALGLADVVTHEAGGTEVDTLFVDEGFGSLDADTLDDVMDRLDGLRAGGRTVGVVSHVSELRSRIPTQVLVDKGRAGSSVTVTTLVG